MGKKIDYTSYPEGKTSLHNLPIETCPKCDRKGEHTHRLNPKGQRVHYYTHEGQVMSVAGLPFFDVTDQCSFTEGK